jgi:hypothetical protein
MIFSAVVAPGEDEAVETSIRLWIRSLVAMPFDLRHCFVQLKDSGLGRRPPVPCARDESRNVAGSLG